MEEKDEGEYISMKFDLEGTRAYFRQQQIDTLNEAINAALTVITQETGKVYHVALHVKDEEELAFTIEIHESGEVLARWDGTKREVGSFIAGFMAGKVS